MADSKINKNLPKNVGIIMDGNGRWALKNSMKISEGHEKGVNAVKEIVKESVNQNINSLTVYAFSSENWKRPKAEVNAIKKLIVNTINEQVNELKNQKVKVRFFGNINDFGKTVIDKINFAERETNTKNTNLDLNVALSYGGKQDILNLVKKISSKVLTKEIKLNQITEKILHDESSVPVDEIDLLIRTGGDKRISNFLLYQIAYAEIMFIDKYWPDFSKNDFRKCLRDFEKIKRRFGKRV